MLSHYVSAKTHSTKRFVLNMNLNMVNITLSTIYIRTYLNISIQVLQFSYEWQYDL